MEADRRHLEEAIERRRPHVLAGVLPHALEAARPRALAVGPRSRVQGPRSRVEEGRGAVPLVVVLPDRAAVGFDDAVTDRQAEAGPLADRLGREEGLEEFRLVLGGHAWAIVLHFEARLAPAVERADPDASAD